MSGTQEEDESERTMFRRPNTRMPMAEPVDELVHVLVLQPTGSAPPMRLAPGSMTIGRTDGADLILPGSDVSRRHCQVDLVGIEIIVGGEVLLTDLNSTNGTFVDGTRVSGTVALSPGARIAIGGHQLLYERRGRRELDEAEALDRELHRANQYVLAILPLPLREGPVRAEWFYVPCTGLGGDAFGYRDLGQGAYAGYMLDVAGHGAGTAMHSVSVANVLRQDGMLGADLRDPSAVMARLNDSFPMETHDGLFFTAWYWVYEPRTRMLTYCAAGIHPAWLVDRATARFSALPSDNPPIGRGRGARYTSAQAHVPAGAMLYMFSDGAFDIEERSAAHTGRRWEIEDFVARIRQPPMPGVTEPQRLYNAVREAARPGPLDDDVSIVAVQFP